MKVIQRRGDLGYLDRWLWVPKSYVSVDAVKSALTHVLSDSYSGRQKFLYLFKETKDHLLVPRAFWDPIKLPFTVVDCRPQTYEEVNYTHSIKLDHRLQKLHGEVRLLGTGKDVQKKSIRALNEAAGGVLQLACGRGKTVIALYKIATGRVPALVMCDNTNLLYQWKEEAERLLTVPGGIGVVGDGKKEWGHSLVIATYHSVANLSESIEEELRARFGQIFWDEGHHISAPTFALTAEMFYGNRYSLTATPNRDDGMHVVADVHIGPVLYKDLTPTMIPNFGFLWTGLELDLSDPTVASHVLDTNQEVHLSKVTTFFGQWVPRLQMLTGIIEEAVKAGRTTLILSNSVAEVVNLMMMYEFGAGPGQFYTDIPIPTPQDVGETLPPEELPPKELKKTGKKVEQLFKQLERLLKKFGDEGEQEYLKDLNQKLTKARKIIDEKKRVAKCTPLNEEKQGLLRVFAAASLLQEVGVVYADLTLMDQTLKKHEVHKKVQNALTRLQKEYIKQMLMASQKSGLLTYGVPPDTRQRFLDTKPVIFAITKYGKEGMNCPRLDTVVLSSLFSSRNGIQQLMGRPTRPMPGKKAPTLLAVVDNVGQCIGMSKKLIGHLREWPKEEGGPYTPFLIGYKKTWNATTTTIQDLFGQ